MRKEFVKGKNKGVCEMKKILESSHLTNDEREKVSEYEKQGYKFGYILSVVETGQRYAFVEKDNILHAIELSPTFTDKELISVVKNEGIDTVEKFQETFNVDRETAQKRLEAIKNEINLLEMSTDKAFSHT